LFARVDVSSSISEDRRDAQVHIRIEPGPRVHVGKIIVQGANRTNENMVRSNLQVRTGKVLDPEDLFDSQRNLVLLGVFRQVAVKLIEPDAPEPTKDVVVEVKERPILDGNFLLGYSLVDGPQVGVDAVYPNLGGYGVNLSTRVSVNYVAASQPAIEGLIAQRDLQGINGFGGRGNIALQQPRLYSLLPLHVGVRLDLVGERVFRPSYRFTRYASIAGADWAAFKWLNISLQYELERDSVHTSTGRLDLRSLSRADQERLRFPVGVFTLHTLRPGLALDFRDDPLNPHKGLFLSGISEITHDISVQPIDQNGNPLPPFPIFTFKVSGNLTFYIPLGPRVVLALSGRMGKIFQLDPESKSIAPKRFFLGGTSTIRGFREEGLTPQDRRENLHEEVANCRALVSQGAWAGCTPGASALVSGQELPSEGGELFTLGKSELRFPVFGSWDLGLFFEAGNLWLSPARFRPYELRYAAGAGVRYLFPIGPAALDVGFNLAPDRDLNESAFQVHFSVGLF
jgi:outer membrane protein assembly factor BamA